MGHPNERSNPSSILGVFLKLQPRAAAFRRPEPIVAKISQEVLAEMIGTTRSRVSHFMNKFRDLGFIDYNGHLEVHSSLLSVVLNEQGRTVAPTA
jgi:CRP-like cAMP-binding protein